MHNQHDVPEELLSLDDSWGGRHVAVASAVVSAAVEPAAPIMLLDLAGPCMHTLHCAFGLDLQHLNC
jgi:hypothetical protein